jgi:PEP-CTERM motif-containing protein
MIRRVLLVVVCAGLAFGFASVALQHLSPSLFRASRAVGPDSEANNAGRNMLLLTQQESLRQIESRPVYAYSVVSGGVKDARELKWVAQHDPVVASHYVGFNYDRARVVRLALERSVYVSYRIGDRVYWTRRRVTLKKGETVITDGKITARSRCGNRVEEAPQQATSSSEPPVAKFDEPMLPALGTGLLHPAVPFQSALLSPPGPTLPLNLYDPFGNGTWVPNLPPPLPTGCVAGKNETAASHTANQGNPCAPSGGGGGAGGGSEVPEPGTWLLVVSGLAAMYWRARQKLFFRKTF